MACPEASSSINMLGIARENVYDNYNSTNTPTAPYAISDLVTGGKCPTGYESCGDTTPD